MAVPAKYGYPIGVGLCILHAGGTQNIPQRTGKETAAALFLPWAENEFTADGIDAELKTQIGLARHRFHHAEKGCGSGSDLHGVGNSVADTGQIAGQSGGAVIGGQAHKGILRRSDVCEPVGQSPMGEKRKDAPPGNAGTLTVM